MIHIIAVDDLRETREIRKKSLAYQSDGYGYSPRLTQATVQPIDLEPSNTITPTVMSVPHPVDGSVHPVSTTEVANLERD